MVEATTAQNEAAKTMDSPAFAGKATVTTSNVSVCVR